MMATQTASKPIDLKLLETELIAAGVPIVALTSTGGDLGTNDQKSIYGINASGRVVELAGAAATVLANHSFAPVNTASLLSSIEGATTVAQVRDRLVAYLRARG